MAWAFVFLSYFMPTAFLFIVLVLGVGAEGYQIAALSGHDRKPETIFTALTGKRQKRRPSMAIGSQAEILEEANGTQWKELVGTARCLRCKGFMVVEHCFDLLNSDGHLGFQTRRCVQCGELWIRSFSGIGSCSC